MTHQSQNTPDTQIDLILRFIEVLSADPDATPPSGLDAADIALARDLARTYTRSALDDSLRQRIWQRALADVVRQRLAQGIHPTHTHLHAQTNGRDARQETESMFAEMTLSKPWQIQQRTRGIWLTGLVAAVCAVVIGGILFAGLGDLQPPDTDPNGGAGINNSTNGDQQIADATATFTPTATHTVTPTVVAPQQLTATAINDWLATSAASSPTPTMTQIMPSPFPPTALPPQPVLSPEDFTGIEDFLVIDDFAAGETLWSNDGRYLLVVHGSDVEIRDMQSPQIRLASGHQEDITAMTLNPQGTVLATGATDGEVHLYILPDARDWVGLPICDCTITEVSFNPTGTLLMIRSEDDVLYIRALPETFYR